MRKQIVFISMILCLLNIAFVNNAYSKDDTLDFKRAMLRAQLIEDKNESEINRRYEENLKSLESDKKLTEEEKTQLRAYVENKARESGKTIIEKRKDEEFYQNDPTGSTRRKTTRSTQALIESFSKAKNQDQKNKKK